MRKIISVVLAAVFVLCLSPPTYAASAGPPAGMLTEVSFTYAPAKPSYFVSAYVDKLTGNQNRLTITVTELYHDGTTKTITESFMIKNNAADTYIVGGYSVYVDTKGNIQIRQIEIVSKP